MDRQNWFDTQLVGSDDLGATEEAVEVAIGRVSDDHLHLLKGVLSGLAVAASGSFSVAVAAGVGYDATAGRAQRMAVATPQTVDCSKQGDCVLSGVWTAPGAS